MEDASIVKFTLLLPEKFPYVIKHDWWQYHPLDDTGLRCDLEIWLSRNITDPWKETLKIHCLDAQYAQQSVVFPYFEHTLHLSVKSIRERQWEGYVYAFIDQKTGIELFDCRSFNAFIENR